jgi:hypothetical protein
MNQLHRRCTDDQISILLQGYCKGLLSRAEVQDMLSIGKTRFFALLREYRQDSEAFSVAYQRTTPTKLSATVEAEIEQALLQEKQIVEDPDLPISGYNYSALRDRLLKKGISVSVPTIIKRAKDLGCYQPRKKRKVHDREVLTASIGALIQHDASTHLWSPFAQDKWALITSIDDYSRMLLFADFFPKETTWAHIRSTQALIQTYGLPLCYYVDCLRVFRFVQGRDSFWRKHVLETDDVDTQWSKVMRILGVNVSYALSSGQGQSGETLSLAPRPHCPYLRLGEAHLHGPSSPCLARRTGTLQQSSSPLHHQRNPTNPLREGPSGREQPFPPFLCTPTLHFTQRCLLPTRDQKDQQFPPHLALQPCDRGAQCTTLRGSRCPPHPQLNQPTHGHSHLVERSAGSRRRTPT